MHRYVRVAVALPIRDPYTYALPEALQGIVQLGHVLWVPFGPRKVTGYALETLAKPDCDPKRLKTVSRLLDPDPAFDANQLKFLRWIADYYLAPLGETIATALPAAMKAKSKVIWEPTTEGVEALATGEAEEIQAEVLREVVSRPGLTRRGLARRLRDLVEPDKTERTLEALKRRQWVQTETLEMGGASGRVREVQLIGNLPGTAGKRQLLVVQAIAAAGGYLDLAELVTAQGPYARTAVRRLAEQGVVALGTRELRDPVVAGVLPDERAPPTLTAAQTAAVAAILGKPRTHLLYGVTGSGKTEVYLRCAAEVLTRNQQVLILVPEIGLTPLLTGRFRARFADAVAVLHSGLTGVQRLREWRRIRAGEAQVAVGARSALFAPFQDLGLVVVDEEHDDSYKQDEGVRYNARDMAVVRGAMANCPVVLGSATPAMESWRNAFQGRYGLIELLERPTPRPVPRIELVNLRDEERVDGRTPLLAASVREALRECLFQGTGKAIVLYNRRGYATYVMCPDCGGAYACPSCGVSLVLHRSHHTLSCHTCGFHREEPKSCPACGSSRLEVLGNGTERVEEALRELLPGIGIARMDADTTSWRGAHHALLERFRTGEFRVLVGTQMVAKGHDFPDVHLAVVVSADHGLRMPDFRAAERTFALLTQVAGRPGRGDVPGRVLVQTLHPEHPVLELLGKPRAFYREQARERRLLAYPPYTRLVLVRLEAADRMQAWHASQDLATRFRETADGHTIQVLGPASAARPRLVGRWRYQIILRGRNGKAFRSWLRTQDWRSPASGVRIAIDVDPRNLM
jgi:primosomal protein N' (replication factor Y)